MPHVLQRQVAETRRHARRLLWMQGLCRVATVLLAALLLASLADYQIHFQDRGIRLLASLGVIVALLWALAHYLQPILTRRLEDVHVAQRIERRFPVLADRLSSSIEFLRAASDDELAGSVQLRQTVVDETTAALADVDLSEVIERRPARQSLALACAVGLLGLGLVLADPASARLAMARLARPWGSDTWPRQNDLVLRDPPTRIAAGQTFEVEVIDRQGHRLPDNARIHYRYDTDGQETEEVEAMQLFETALVARKENVARPFRYRVEGGDDQTMPWTTLEVVDPPRITTLKTTLYPPEYTGWPSEDVENNFTALVGTRVALRGSTTKPLTSAVLKRTKGQELECRITDGGFGFELAADASEPLVVEASGPYWFEFVDTEGLRGGGENRFEIRAVRDLPPSVNIEKPAANSFVTATAIVPLKVIVKDDLAVRDIILYFSRSESIENWDGYIPLFVGPKQVTLAEASESADLSNSEKKGSSRSNLSAGLAGGLPGDSRTVEHRWDLAALNLKPGDHVLLRAQAVDYRPQMGNSTERRLTIITPQELDDRLAQRQGLILGELRRVLKMQEEAKAQTGALEIQLRAVGHLEKQNLDHAHGAELRQRQVMSSLTNPHDGVPVQIHELLAELENNRVENAGVARHMQEVLDEIDRLHREHLSAIEQKMTSAIKQAETSLTDPPSSQNEDTGAVTTALASAGEHQAEVVRGLEGLLEGLSEWDGFRRFGRDVAQIEQEQAELEQATRKLTSKTLGKNFKDLKPQQQADLKKLAHRQGELGRQFDKLLEQMESVHDRLEESDPLPSGALADALQVARQQGTSGQMRSAGEQLERNRLGQASSDQQQVRKALTEMLDALANRREHELGRLVKKLREAEKELGGLRQQQEGLRKKQAAAARAADKSELDQLARAQQELERQLNRFARRLERLQADRAAQTAGSAAAKSQRAGEADQNGNAQAGEEQSEAAADDLRTAQEELAERRREAETDLAQMQMARLGDTLKALQDREQQLVAETQRIDGLKEVQTALSAGQEASLHTLAQQQRLLEADTASQAEQLGGAEVFQLALRNAANDLSRAAAALEQGETGSAAQQPAQEALTRFSQLLAALKPAPKKKTKSQDPGAAGGQSGGTGTGQDGEQLMTELRLLKMMQEDLNRRVALVSEQETSAARTRRLAELSGEQGQLAEAAFRLSQPVEINPEDDLENLVPRGKPDDDNPTLDQQLLPEGN